MIDAGSYIQPYPYLAADCYVRQWRTVRTWPFPWLWQVEARDVRKAPREWPHITAVWNGAAAWRKFGPPMRRSKAASWLVQCMLQGDEVTFPKGWSKDAGSH